MASKGIEYVYDSGPGNPQRYEEGVKGLTSDRAAMELYESEVQRHVLLRLAEEAGNPVPDHPSAYTVEVVGLSVWPYRKATNIPAEAATARAVMPSQLIEYEIHKITTARGRMLRESGASRRLTQAQAEAIHTLDLAQDPAPSSPWV